MRVLKIEKVDLKELFDYPYKDDISLLALLSMPIYFFLIFFIGIIVVPLVSIRFVKK